MRIAYLSSDFGVPVFGTKGASVHVRALTTALRSLGHEVLVLTPRAGGPCPGGYDVPLRELAPEPLEQAAYELLAHERSAGLAVAREVRAVLSAAALRHRALPLLAEFAPDAIYERYSLFGTAGVALARDLGVPLVLEVNAPLADEQRDHRGLVFVETARELERTILRSADRVVAVSSALSRWLVRAGVEQGRVTVLPNAVDLDAFGSVVRRRSHVRPTVGFVGTLKPWHDVAGLVRAVALLHRKGGPSPQLLVVGDGPERSSLERLVAAEGIAASVAFVGTVEHSRVPRLLAGIDVGVVPYSSGVDVYFSPLKLFEYLAAALPVVAAHAGDIGHCIRPGETGILYPPGDVERLADGIAALLSDAAGARRLGEAGREHVRAEHTWVGNARAVVRLLDGDLSVARAA